VSAATQAQARSALQFLYKEVLHVTLPWLSEVVSARPSRRLPVVLTPGEAAALLAQMSGVSGLVAALLYGTGMRLLEGLRLRVKDVEFTRREILVREGKGAKDRVTVLPENLVALLQAGYDFGCGRFASRGLRPHERSPQRAWPVVAPCRNCWATPT
jgi:integrase